MDELCIHYLHRCTICHLPAENASRKPQTSNVFLAKHDGICTGCGFDLRVGEQARFVGERIRHVGCTDA